MVVAGGEDGDGDAMDVLAIVELQCQPFLVSEWEQEESISSRREKK